MPNRSCSQTECLCNSCKQRVWTEEGLCGCGLAVGVEDKPPCVNTRINTPEDCGGGYEPSDGVSGSRCVDAFLVDEEWGWLEAERPSLAEKLRGAQV